MAMRFGALDEMPENMTLRECCEIVPGAEPIMIEALWASGMLAGARVGGELLVERESYRDALATLHKASCVSRFVALVTDTPNTGPGVTAYLGPYPAPSGS